MEDNEQELIRSRLTSLISHIRCTDEFLWFFYEKRILTPSEIQEINGRSVDAEKASTFLWIIKTRTNGFTVLKEGLLKFKQTGALNVLTGREELNSEPTLEETQSRIANLSFEREELKSGPTLVQIQSRIVIFILSICLLVYLSFKQPAPSQKRNISFDVFPPVVSFTGRTMELEQLHKMILRSQDAETIAVMSQVTLVAGLGGIGKTQLAKEYVRLYKTEFDDNVLWMNTESEKSLAASFQRLAEEKLNISTKDGNGSEISAKSIAEAVYKYFEGVKALFVLDNAENALWLKQFMPKFGQRPTLFVLITSRETEWDRRMEVLQLDGLTEEDAIKLIQKELRTDGDDTFQMEDIRNLAQTLQSFPLALQQAIAYIYEQKIKLKYSIKDYLQEFESKQYQLLAFHEVHQFCCESFTTTTTTTWSITVDKITQDLNNGWLASIILNVVAYLGADNIHRNLFYRLPSLSSETQFASINEDQINNAARLLVKYSMLNGKESQSVLSVHRLVQSVTRNQLARDGLEEYFLKIAIQLLQGSDDDDFPAENIGHALIVWRHAFKFNQIIQGYAFQVYFILWKMREIAHPERVLFGSEALGKIKEVLGENHEDCLWIQQIIGLIFWDQGHLDKAVLVLQDILSKAKSLFGEGSDYLSLLTNEALGNTLRESGKIQEALKFFREVLDQKKIIYGANDSTTLITETNYGVALLDSGKLTEAESIFQRIIEIYIKRGDEKSKNAPQYWLAIIYSKKGEFEKGLQILRKIYKRINPVWTENVGLFAVVCFNLGNMLNGVGKHEEALKILEENIEKIKEQLGSQHVRTLEIQHGIGICYRDLGNLNKALEILQSVHQAYVSISGEDSLGSLFASRSVAVVLSRLGEHSQAIIKYEEIIPKIEALLGKENLEVILIKRDFAIAIERTAENLHIALGLLKQAKAAMIPIVGGDSPIVQIFTEDIKRIEKETKTS